MSKRINPRRRPATAADVKRAKDDAMGQATRLAMAIFLTVLVDKFGGADHIKDVWDEVVKLSEEIIEGRVSVSDLADVLDKEYDIII
jgi:hypothetical protein